MVQQGELFADVPVVVPAPVIPGARPGAEFDGADYRPERDRLRLTGQLRRVFDLMTDGRWRTLAAIAEATRDPVASVSAQIRHLRKPKFGGHTVERRHVGNGLYEYRLVVNPNERP